MEHIIPIIETPIFKASIFVDCNGDFRIRFREVSYSTRYEYFNDAYKALQDKVIEFFSPFKEEMSYEQHRVINEKQV